MPIFVFSFFVFVAVVLIMWSFYWAWLNLLDPRNKAKKERLRTIHDAVHSGEQSRGSAIVPQSGNEMESWLRGRFKTFVWIENLIKRAGSSLAVGRLALLMLGLFAVVLALGFLRHLNPWILLPLALAAAIGLPLLWLSQQASKRGKAFGEKLPEALNYISRALRSSHSLNSAIAMVGKEFVDPIGTEFKVVSDKIGFGIPFKDAIVQLADGIQSRDLNFLIVSLLIQHETGGNLTELLDGLASTMRQRIKLRGKIHTISAEGRASAWVLGGLPFVIVGILMFTNPGYISILWETSQGHNVLLAIFVLMSIGLFVMNRIVRIKV